jgi:hypothetical protein
MNMAPSQRIGSRNAQRWRIDAMIDARDGNRHQRAMAADISVSGLRLLTLSPLRVNQRLWVKIGNIEPREIKVLWVDGFYAGCNFASPLADYILEFILKSTEISKAAVGHRREHPRL